MPVLFKTKKKNKKNIGLVHIILKGMTFRLIKY